MMKQISLILIILIVFSACTVTPYPQAIQPSPLPGQSAADAQATLTAWQIQVQATRDYQATIDAAAMMATRQSINATEQAQMIATGTAQAQAADATAAAVGLSIRATSQALDSLATRESMSNSATATAESQRIGAVATLQADEATRLAHMRESEQIRQERARILNAWLPAMMIAILLIVTGGIAAFIYVQLTKNKPVTVWQDNRQITVLPDGAGGFRMLPGSSMPRLLPPGDESYMNDDENVVDGEFEPVLDVLEGEQAILIHGAKGTGKTTLLLWLMASRQNALIVDPHGSPGKWPNCHMVGAERDFGAIEETLNKIMALMIARYGDIGRGAVAEGMHDKLTLFVDEYRAIVQNVPTAKRIIATLLTEARKANIDIILVSHSRNVKALGLDGEGDLREGFSFVHLAVVRGRRTAEVSFGMNGTTAVPVELPGPFSNRVIPAYQNNYAAQILAIDLPPTELNEPTGIVTPAGFVSVDEARRMLQMAADNRETYGRELRRNICNDMFGHMGGDAYQRLKYVLDAAGQSSAMDVDEQVELLIS